MSYHLIGMANHRLYARLANLDYVAIVGLIVGSCVPVVWYAADATSRVTSQFDRDLERTVSHAPPTMHSLRAHASLVRLSGLALAATTTWARHLREQIPRGRRATMLRPRRLESPGMACVCAARRLVPLPDSLDTLATDGRPRFREYCCCCPPNRSAPRSRHHALRRTRQACIITRASPWRLGRGARGTCSVQPLCVSATTITLIWSCNQDALSFVQSSEGRS
jgi:hypothetical protein